MKTGTFSKVNQTAKYRENDDINPETSQNTNKFENDLGLKLVWD